MKIETILLVINQFILFGFLICIIILFNKEKFNNSEKLNNTEKFGDAPAASPYPQGKGPHILLTDDNGNMTKDDNSATLTSWVNEQIKTAIKNLKDSIYGNDVQTTTIQNLIDSINQRGDLSTYMRYGDNFKLALQNGPQVAVSTGGEGQLLQYNPGLAREMRVRNFNASKQ